MSFASRARAELSYAKEDYATVRVFAVRGIQDVNIADKGKRPLWVAFPQAGHGSGLLMSQEGVVLTAAHVVEGARLVAVRFPKHKEAYLAETIYINRRKDIAFLQLGMNFRDNVDLPMTVPKLKVRQPVYAVGYPLDGSRDLPQSTGGVISGELPNGDLQIAMSVNPGNSGGPLMNAKSEIIGVVVRRGDPSEGVQGIAHAVPIERARDVWIRRVKDSPERARAMRKRKKLRSQSAVAQFVSEVASISLFGMARAITDEPDAKLDETVRLALLQGKDDPDILALASAHYWNLAVTRRELDGRGWKKPLADSKVYARLATERETGVVGRSPFLFRSGQYKKQDVPYTLKAPRNLGGFKLGISQAEAAKICVAEGMRYTRGGKVDMCSESPTSVEFNGPVHLQFCGDRLCSIELYDRPSRSLSKVWMGKLERVHDYLTNSYGKHKNAKGKMPKSCRWHTVECVRDGKASIYYDWRWRYRRLKLAISNNQGDVAIRLRLTTRQYK
ncbi:MAG: S1C family serine protease [Polyangiaceae bacterium]|nr:S1C family serine protease [Polyangiaceae bacterium]